MELKEKLVASYVAFESGIDINTDIHEIRTDALHHFEKLGFPSKKLEAWKYLTIYEEDNPERACRIYDYAEKYVKKYPELDEVPSIFDGEDAIFTR